MTSPTKPPYVPGRSVYPAQVPAWADITAQYTLPHTDGPAVPPWPIEPTRKNSQRALWLVLIILTLLVLEAAGYLVQRNSGDTGVAACKAMATGQGPGGKDADNWSAADYAQARQIFADSSYPAIRDNGTLLVDLTWQMKGLGEGDFGLLAFVGPFTNAYAGLSGGCAEVGYTLPPLGGN